MYHISIGILKFSILFYSYGFSLKNIKTVSNLFSPGIRTELAIYDVMGIPGENCNFHFFINAIFTPNAQKLPKIAQNQQENLLTLPFPKSPDFFLF